MNKEALLRTIISPHVSEKTTIIVEKNNQYVFRVANEATKSSVKEAIEFIFNIKVKSVCITKVKAKKKVFKGITGNRKAWKKAYVTLYSDQKLEMLGV